MGDPRRHVEHAASGRVQTEGNVTCEGGRVPPKIDDESRLAVYYDMACVHEAAGNSKKAYETFMEVYSMNIDYRDVADRIKSLKAAT